MNSRISTARVAWKGISTTLLVLALALGIFNSPAGSQSGAGDSGDALIAGPVDQVHLAWVNDSDTTLNIVWHTADASVPSMLEYRSTGGVWVSAMGAERPSGAPGKLHEATLTGLLADTEYGYRIFGGASGWTDVYSTTTAPISGAGGFGAVFMADTGIAGREDGLAGGTLNVIDAVQAIGPQLILGGGDYAFYNTETRYATLDQAIDAWFNQMEPIASSAPFMPSYGNHEIDDADDADGFDEWAARFPTPDGYDGRRFYSFDVGNAHFISIYGPFNMLTDEAEQWVHDDIVAAQTAGKRWIIPYFHTPIFSDGGNHSPSTVLRNKFGPMFEQLGVRLVLTAHDQAYERTFPLLNVPNTNTPFSTRQACYEDIGGVIYLKASPGGKLSNVNWNFSQFQTAPAPDWTAVRSNNFYHFVHLEFNPDQTLTVNGYGVTGESSVPALIDRFTLTDTGCSPELAFDQGLLQYVLDYDSPAATGELTLSASDGPLPGSLNVSSDAAWLTVTPGVSGVYSLSVDPSGLAPGAYKAALTASASGYLDAYTPVVLVVRGDTDVFSLWVSSAPDRSGATALHGAALSGDAYVFVQPVSIDVGQVAFTIDLLPHNRESNPPYDLVGTTTGDLALPYDTRSLSQGAHNITAQVVILDGSVELASATFTVDNGDLPYPIYLPLTIK